MCHRNIRPPTGKTSIHSMDQTHCPVSGNNNETISQTLNQRFNDELLSPEHVMCDRNVFEISLTKDPVYGVGICIVGGAGKNLGGFFVKSLIKDSPAFLDGRIKPGDQILEINEEILGDIEHHEAVRMIKESGDIVKFLVSQVKPPGSIKRKEFDEDAEFQWKLQNSIESDKDFRTNMNKFRSDSPEPSVSQLELQNSKESVGDFRTKMDKFKGDSSSLEKADKPVSSVHSNIDVNNDTVKTDVKNASKKSGKDKKQEKIVDVDGENESIPESESEREGAENVFSATIEAHSTLSLVDSLKSEAGGSETSADRHYKEQHAVSEESDTDSDFEDVCTAVIDNTYTPPLSRDTPPTQDLGEGPGEEFDVFLEKVNGSFGLHISGGVNTTVRHGGIYVKSVVPDGAADREGFIRKGDRILEVDSVSMMGLTHKEAVETLCQAPPFSRLKVERTSLLAQPLGTAEGPQGDVGSDGGQQRMIEVSAKGDDDVEDLYSSFVNEYNSYTVDLTKGIYGLGFSTVGGQVSSPDIREQVVRIKRVFLIGPAADAGILHSGDVILAVNGESVAGLSHKDTMSKLRSAGKQVQLLMCRPDPMQLPPLANTDTDESLVVTPNGSGSVQSNTDSDSDSEVEITPRGEHLTANHSKPAQQSHDLANHLGDIVDNSDSDEQDDCDGDGKAHNDVDDIDDDSESDADESYASSKQSSLAPPLPISPPPTMLSSMGSVDSDTTGGVAIVVGTADEEESEEESDPPRGAGLQVQMGVAELIDSCHSEMIVINNVKNLKQGAALNTSLIVREDSAVSFDNISRDDDVTPVTFEGDDVESRDGTPFDERESILGQTDEVSEFDKSIAKSEVDEEIVEAAQDSGEMSENVIDSLQDSVVVESLADTALSDLKNDIESDTVNNLSKSMESTSNSEYKHVSGSLGPEDTEKALTDLGVEAVGTFTVDNAQSSVIKVLDDPNGELCVENDIDVQFDYKDVHVEKSESERNSSDESDFDDDDIRRLEKKYLDIEQQEELVNESENDEYDISFNDDVVGTTNFSTEQEVEISYATLTDSASEQKEDDDDDESDTDKKKIVSASVKKLLSVESVGDIDTRLKDDSINEMTSENEPHCDVDSEHVSDESAIEVNELNKDDEEVFESDVDDETESNDESEDSEQGESAVREKEPSQLAGEMPLQPGEFLVRLRKPGTGELGFNVAGGANTTGGCYVKSILRDPALSDGRLKAGDKLIMVNDIDMRPLNHFEAVSVLREATDDVTIRVFRQDLVMGDFGQAEVEKLSHDLQQELDKQQPNLPSLSTKTAFESEDEEIDEDSSKQQISKSSPPPSDPEDSESQPEGDHLLQDLIQSLEASRDQFGAGVQESGATSPRGENLWQDRAQRLDMPSPGRARSPQTAETSVYQIDLEKPTIGGLGISLVTAESRNMTEDNDNSVTVEDDDDNEFEKLIKGGSDKEDDNDDDDDDDDDDEQFYVMKRYDESQCWCHNLRTLDITVPDEITEDWLFSLSLIDVRGSVGDYIVSQGPLPETLGHFWQMIWEQRVTVLVMLTLDKEGSKVKCHRYWPESADTPLDICDGEYRLSLLYENELEAFTVRSVLMEHVESGDTRRIYQLNYTAWPDHGVPPSALPLLQCMRLSHLLRSEGPILVHCSAGIGRSGTFIAIDLALAHIERGQPFEVPEIVRELRRQRQGMIQTRVQLLNTFFNDISSGRIH
ncbi:PTN13-like protein [Mya arenaria]|uniref:PTN13-like protein n=1 Tax=Mya arenaria TaxID=6604 RepID=A0ABY7DDW1_MYAAR|nr:PTN13-like protein [Mya arenaria]